MNWRVLAFIFLLNLTACSSVSISGEWKDTSWNGAPARSVVVVGISRSESMRRIFEDTFAQQLQQAGFRATPGYSQLAFGDTSANVPDFIKASKADAVIVTRILRI